MAQVVRLSSRCSDTSAPSYLPKCESSYRTAVVCSNDPGQLRGSLASVVATSEALAGRGLPRPPQLGVKAGHKAQ